MLESFEQSKNERKKKKKLGWKKKIWTG
uniref:Uncharacterized protein n=1 Tax=Anguilla anguilla TaxID=7936 RepID=A0A0E9W3Q1_ANGAN